MVNKPILKFEFKSPNVAGILGEFVRGVFSPFLYTLTLSEAVACVPS